MAGPRPAIEPPKPSSEGREHVLELRRVLGRVADRDRVAALEAALGATGDQLHVLEPERGARPHRQRRVHRQRLDRLVELEVEDRDNSLLALLLNALALDVGDDADAEAAGAHLVALHQLGAVRHLGLDLVRRHERQPVVRLIGDEHGDDRDHHGHRADEDGAGPELSSAAPHWPSRKSRAEVSALAGAGAAGAAAAAPACVGSGVVTPGCVGPRNWLHFSMCAAFGLTS